MSKTLIVYWTRYEATAEVAKEIARILEEQYDLSVQLINLYEQKVKYISGYDNIVLGSGIKMGRWTGKAKRFLKKTSRVKSWLFLFDPDGQVSPIYMKALLMSM